MCEISGGLEKSPRNMTLGWKHLTELHKLILRALANVQLTKICCEASQLLHPLIGINKSSGPISASNDRFLFHDFGTSTCHLNSQWMFSLRDNTVDLNKLPALGHLSRLDRCKKVSTTLLILGIDERCAEFPALVAHGGNRNLGTHHFPTDSNARTEG